MTIGNPVIKSECYDRKPGDVNRYDFLWALKKPLNASPKAGAKVAYTPLAAKKAVAKKKTKPVARAAGQSVN